VVGEKDDDGFYWGECKLKQGFVPSNMIAEMNINEAEDLFLQANCDVGLHNELNSRGQVNGELDVDVISDNLGREEPAASDRLSFWENLENDHLGPRKMKTLYDYDPARDSPNVDSEVCLTESYLRNRKHFPCFYRNTRLEFGRTRNQRSRTINIILQFKPWAN
jgi:hypothetical protein